MATKKTAPKKNSGGFLSGVTDSITGIINEGLKDLKKASPAKVTPDVVNRGPSVPSSKQPDTIRAVDSAPLQSASYNAFVSKSNRLDEHDQFAPYGAGYEAEYAKQSVPILENNNGNLSFEGSKHGIPLFVTDLSMDFAINGSTAKAQTGAVWYPKNFRQTDMVIKCQAPNQLYYGKVVEAIRDSQLPNATIARLSVSQGGPKPSAKYNTHGRHDTFQAVGYVSLIKRRHERFVYSPEFEITFTVVRFVKPTEWGGNPHLQYNMNVDWHTLVAGEAGYYRDYEDPPLIGKTAEERKKIAETYAKKKWTPRTDLAVNQYSAKTKNR